MRNGDLFLELPVGGKFTSYVNTDGFLAPRTARL